MEFDYLIKKLTEYLSYVNSQIRTLNNSSLIDSRHNIYQAIKQDSKEPVTFVNFNYTDTLSALDYANEDEVIHIHGRVSDRERNPIIFGYGDETDPMYQKIEDTGDNIYLEHIKSFGYFRTNNYRRLISTLNAGHFKVYIVGHSCGLSDRILLSSIFEHRYCTEIEIFFHKRSDGSDNYKEITQEISRHFKPQNKESMRVHIKPYDSKNFIPQFFSGSK